MPVEFLGGLTGHPDAPKKGDTCTLIGDADALHIRRWKVPLLARPSWVPVGTFTWPEVRRIDVAGTSVSQAELAAVAVFGVLGLAAARGGTYIAVSAGTTDALFRSDEPAAKLRLAMERLVPDTWRSAVLRFDGQPVH